MSANFSNRNITTTGSTTTNSLTTGTLTATGLTTVAGVQESLGSQVVAGASVTLNIDTITILDYVLTNSTPCTFTMPTATNGKSFTLLLKQAPATPTTATFTGVDWGGAGTYSVTATINKIDILSFVCMNSKWYGSAAKGFDP